MLAALGASGCAGVTANVESPTLRTENLIRAALADGEVHEAFALAVGYERRNPGSESWSLLGRTLWQFGDLAAAEGFYRRADADGHPEGRLGLARAAAARGDFARALRLAEPLLLVQELAPRAARFVAGLYWRAGDRVRAASLLDASEPENVGTLEASLRQAGPEATQWTGSTGVVSTELVAGTTHVRARVDGVDVHLLVDPSRPRSSIRPEAMQRIGAGSTRLGGIFFATLELGPLRVAAIPLRVTAGGPGDGVIGFDVLSELRWIWWPATGAFLVGTTEDAGGKVRFQEDLARTHWLGTRTIVDGLAIQLLVAPRIEGRTRLAVWEPNGETSTISVRALRTLGNEEAGPGTAPVDLMTAIGGWRASLSYRVVPVTAAFGEVPVASAATLGGDFARGWGWRWAPESRQLALIQPPD